MAVAFVQNHTATTPIKVAGTTIGLNITTIVPAGNTLIAHIIFDNAATASKPIVSSITKAAGETANWVLLGAARSTSTTAGAFASGEMWAIRTTVDWPIASYTVTLDTSTVMKATQAQEFSGVNATLRSTAGTAYSTTTTAASAATTGTTPVIGDLAIGLMFQSNAAAFATTDTDTLGGAWTGPIGVGSTGSSAATNNFGQAQYKILTAASQQTLNAAAALAAGNGSIVAILQAAPDLAITQAAYRFYADGTEAGSVALAVQDTAYTADLTAGDVNLLLRTRLQSTNAGVLVATDDWQLQYEKNASGIWTNVGEVLADSFAATIDLNLSLGTSVTVLGQSFLGNGQPLTRAGFALRKSGTPVGNVTALIYAHTGTFGTTSTGTGSPLATSAGVAAASLTTTVTMTYFLFDGTFTPANGTPYVLAFTHASGASDWVAAGENTTGGHAGSRSSINNAVWASGADSGDLLFELYTSSSTVPGFNSANLTDGAATTNRLGAGTGSFVAGKVSEDGLVDDLLLTANNYTELLYAVTLKQAAFANGDTVRFRVLRNGVATGFTYTQTPTLSITNAVAATGRPKVYVGGAFTKKPLKVWTGTVWVEKPVKVWTGTVWKTLT